MRATLTPGSFFPQMSPSLNYAACIRLAKNQPRSNNPYPVCIPDYKFLSRCCCCTAPPPPQDFHISTAHVTLPNQATCSLIATSSNKSTTFLSPASITSTAKASISTPEWVEYAPTLVSGLVSNVVGLALPAHRSPPTQRLHDLPCPSSRKGSLVDNLSELAIIITLGNLVVKIH